ncbi:MAG: SMP-30/gluconolactonase/LRE family protein [Candidatus Marinimicrobia bacterium]|nr:SMP-30/gluconolactonase/LRE family protein [Candidatus Neomarinimicrobiota bacterium]
MKKSFFVFMGLMLVLLLVFILIFSCSSRRYFSGDFQLVAEGLNFPEGPAYFRDRLVFSNCYGGWIGNMQMNMLDTLISEKDGLVNTNGTVFDGEGNLYICEYGKPAILKYSPEGNLSILSESDQGGKRFNRPNDITISPSGMLYFTDPKSYSRDLHDGRLFRIDPRSGETVWLIEGLQFPNGLCFSPKGDILYVGESVNKNILKIDCRLGILDTLITLPAGNRDPDGMDCDVEGNLYIAYFGGGMIYVVSPQGILLDSLATPGRKPSNVEFGGEDMKTLYVTECETNAVYAIRTNRAGLKKQ